MAAKERQERAGRQPASAAAKETARETAREADKADGNGDSLAERGAQVRPRKPVRQDAKAPDRPAHEAYAVRALVLQGGGALGAYQAGVYQGLAEGGIYPNWVAGISIGALNAAVIAGNPPERRIEQLRAFWEYICAQPWLPSLSPTWLTDGAESWPEPLRIWFDALHATRAMVEGQRGFFQPRSWPELLMRYADPGRASFYDTSPLKATLERFADFDLINHRPDLMRVSVGAVNVRTGNFAYFDNTRDKLCPEHFMASGALPPGFPAVEIDGEYYWDGGLVSNTPLAEVLTAQPRRDALIFQVDLWSARGKLPHDLVDVAEREKEIRYSSRTRAITDYMREQQNMRRMLNEVMALVPQSRRNSEWYRRAAEQACDARRNVIQLIYRDKSFENMAKDYQFGLLTMNEHWTSGLDDIRQTLRHPQWLAMPSREQPFVTHDVHRGNGG
ncbi:patatin-like phospholipase family protein [Cupriavidus oxalaticus]|uniref:Patatin-like phospholipase family protein n=1 Tax=Cupriavidus oxalaticus TaxID=96344 RepID=A0A375FRV7_9BURK|nr:patatin-like phospholipase family protein [Cupriavidus oxalaticus]QRQ87222.1 patatin-like phospholipase family protein [Cupriavidus oxalaticus]QRQ94450.1 patatin-like phospholipase family protein [Cupriavidus oxalaticus]WQD83092.1 patatin-like phospholipase family protein [Cupriavidus oxalaticus]SPC11043.1 Predicted esterase of the alpha-beta hydrolase superfamily [Cupriavidus oxalaticus]